MKQYVHSYTALKMHMQCPALFHAKYIARTAKQETSPAMDRGNRIHADLERAIKQPGTAPPSEPYWTPPGLTDLLHAAGAQAEIGMGVDANGASCDPFAPDVLLRGWMDVRAEDANGTLICDWKTGKYRPDMLQADVYATLERAKHGRDDYPVTFTWIYVDERRIHPTRPDRYAADRVYDAMDRIERDQEYRPTQNFGCRWCPVAQCKFNQFNRSNKQ